MSLRASVLMSALNICIGTCADCVVPTTVTCHVWLRTRHVFVAGLAGRLIAILGGFHYTSHAPWKITESYFKDKWGVLTCLLQSAVFYYAFNFLYTKLCHFYSSVGFNFLLVALTLSFNRSVWRIFNTGLLWLTVITSCKYYNLYYLKYSL